MAKPKTVPKATREKPTSIYFQDDEKALVQRAAALEDEEKPGRWIRKVAVREARRVLGEEKAGR